MNSSNISQSTIMFTDIVGYSAMVNNNQTHALELLDTHDKIIEPIIGNHKGTIIKKIGDAIFAEFPSANQCHHTAVSIQLELVKRNSLCKPKDHINIRIGLHTGEVIRKDNDLFGHDVNLCSRIESVATSNSIAASSSFIDALPDNSCLSREIGYVKLKNITNPQQLYKIYLNKDDYNKETAKALYKISNANGIAIVDIDSYKVDETFSIGMLYINNLGNETDESIAYHLSEELINDLGNINEIRTPTFNQTLQYKDSKLGYDDIGRQLEIEYLLLGNILKKDNVLQITCELLNTNTGDVVWSDSFEEPISNIKNIRRHLITSILKQFKIELPEKLINVYSEQISQSNEALELYFKGKYCYNILKEKDDLERAEKYIIEALDIDNDFIEARVIYGMILHRLGNFDDAESNLLKAQDSASEKKYLQGLSDVYKGLQVLYSDKAQYEKARICIEKGLKIQVDLHNNLFEAKLRIDYANLLNHMGNPESSIEQNEQAIALLETMEEDPLIAISNAVLFNTYFTIHQYSKAISHGMKALRLFRKLDMHSYEGRILVIIGEAYSKIGDYEEMEKFITDAEPIIKQFNDLFFLGKIDFFKSEKYLNENNIDLAFSHLDKSIDWYDLSDNQFYKIDMMVEKLKLYIETNQLDKAESYIKKIQIQTNKIKGTYDCSLISVIECLADVANNPTTNINSDSLLKNISNDPNHSKNMFAYWYLARIYICIDDNDLAKTYHSKSKEIFKLLADQLQSDKEKKYFKNIFYHNKILSNLERKQAENKADVKYFLFCPGCGFNNETEFSFCPTCGNNLTQ